LTYEIAINEKPEQAQMIKRRYHMTFKKQLNIYI